MVEEVRGLTTALEASLRNALADMGTQFRDALSANTKDEFGQLASVVQGSAGVLESMTGSFASMEAALRTIVEEARSSTTAQMSASVEQTQRLNELVEGLMARLNQAAQTNFDSLGAVLTNVVGQLSEKVTALSQELVHTVQAATQQSQASASDTLTKAGEWSAQTGAQLREVLATLQSNATDFERAGETLLAAQAILEQTLSQNTQALRALGDASNQVSTYTLALAGLQQKVDEGQKTQLSLAMQSREAVAKLSETMDRQAAIVGQYQQTVEQYQRVFGGIDQELDRTLSAILVKMEAYTKSVERHFDTVLSSANKHLPDIAATLQDANDRLREQLDDFIDALERMRRPAA
jgi:tetratricopeptide (TPR) repeat protein